MGMIQAILMSYRRLTNAPSFAAGQLVHTLDNPNAFGTSTDDYFGYSSAMSGNYAIVGAYHEDDAGGTKSGKAYIYNVTTGALLRTLDNPNVYGTSANDYFGYSVAISGNYAIVGAPYESDVNGSSKAYIFDVTTGALVHILSQQAREFGFFVGISGNYASVSAIGESSYSGAVYIFNVTTGDLIHTLDNPNAYGTSAGDTFGYSVSISGNYAIVGAYDEGDAGGIASGKAYIFNVITGALLHTLDNPNAFGTSSYDHFGELVAISGNYAIVGAYWEDDAGGTESGKAYIFDVTTGALLHTLSNPNAFGTSATDRFGSAVAISGNYAIIGAFSEGDAGGIYSGKAYIFDVTTGALVHTLDDPNAFGTSRFDIFGGSVAISGNYAIVCAYEEGDASGYSSGKAYIFTLVDIVAGVPSQDVALPWQLLHTLDNPDAGKSLELANTDFGRSGMAISSDYITILDGTILSVYDPVTRLLLRTIDKPSTMTTFTGAIATSGNYAIVGFYLDAGTYSGKAYIFNVTTGALLHTLDNPNAYGTSANDYFGVSVAMSGNYAIVGAYGEDDASGTESGKAYIFDVITGALVRTLDNPNAYDTSQYDNFGQSIAMSGNYAIIGTPTEGAVVKSSGVAYIFNVTTGALMHTLDNPNAYGTSVNDRFGYVIDISGNYAIVGSVDTVGVDSYSGKVYIYNVTTGVLLHTLTIPYVAATLYNSNTGITVAISGNYAIIGASYVDGASQAESGKAYIYDVLSGTLLLTFDNPNIDGITPTTNYSPDLFGYSVAMSGNYAIVSTLSEDRVYMYDIPSNLTTPVHIFASAVSTLQDYFSSSVAISGNYAIVGAYNESDSTGTYSGKAYIYNVTTGALMHTLDNPNANGTGRDQFGMRVAISENYAIVGVPYETVRSGVVYIFDILTGTLLHTLVNPNVYGTAANDSFGGSVAISGNYAIIGAYNESDVNGTNSGKAYIFNATTGALVRTIDNPNAYGSSDYDYFGVSVAISNNYAVVGSPYEGNNNVEGTGWVYVFDTSTGALLHSLANPNAEALAWVSFGESIAISDNYILVGAPYESDSSGEQSGKAYIYDALSGSLLHTLSNPNTEGSSSWQNFGSALSISGNYAIVNSPYRDDGVNIWSGKAHIFNVTTGALLYTLNNPNAYGTSDRDFFSTSVAISGNYIIAGSLDAGAGGGTNSGKAYVFTLVDIVTDVPAPAYSAGQLVHTLSPASADQYYFGRSVAISGNYAIVGLYDNTTGGMVSLFDVTTGSLLRVLTNPIVSTGNNSFGYSVDISGNYAIVSNTGASDAGGLNSGKAYIYNVTTGALLYTLDNPNPDGVSVNDNFGVSVAISGNYAIVGSYVESGSGKAYIYNVTTGALVHTLDNPNAFGTSTNDYFGGKVSISGNYAIVAAWGEDDVNGTDSGKAYIYNVSTGALMHTLDNPNPFGTSQYDTFGFPVAISGSYAIVGASGEGDAGGRTSGKAYVYNVITGALVRTIDNPNAYGTSEYDYFGVSVAISGNYALIGAYDEDDAGIRNDSGKAYIFNVTTGALVHTIDNPNAYDTPDYDEFGEFVAISGNYAIVGTRNEDDANGNSSGKAYIFTLIDIPA